MTSDAIVLLKEEHKELLRLFRSYRSLAAAESADRGDTADRIVHAVTVHTYLEDEVLFPRVRELLPDAQDDTVRHYQEHRTADRLCEEISALEPGDPGFDDRVTALIDSFTRHIEEEEHDWFPRVRAAVSRKELQEIGTRLLAVRETAPRPPGQSGFPDGSGGSTR